MCWRAAAISLLADAIEMLVRADKDLAIGDGGGCIAFFIEPILGDHRELVLA